MTSTLAQQLYFDLMVFKSKTNVEKLRTRKRELCGVSRNTDVIIDHEQLARLVKKELLRQRILKLIKEYNTL